MTRRTSPCSALAVALLTSACAGASPSTTGARPNDAVATADPAPDQVDEVSPDAPSVRTDGGVTIAAAERWGAGRALAAASADDGSLAVVTTASVWIAPAAAGAPVELDGEVVERAPVVAISDDGSIVAAVTAEPATIVWYDSDDATAIAAAELPAGARPERLRFIPGTNALVAETPVGPLVWSSPPVEGEPPMTPEIEAIAGISALRSSGVVITPLIGTRSVAVHRDGVTLLVELDLPDVASVQRAASTPTGAFVAIEAAIGTNEFDRPDHIVLVDPQRYAPQTTLPLGRDIPSDGWDVVGDLVAIAEGSRIDLVDAAGAAVRSLEFDATVGVQRIAATAGGLMAVLTDSRMVFWPADTWEPVVVHEGGRVLGRIDVSADRTVVSVTDTLGAVRSWSGLDGSELDAPVEFEIGELTDVAVSDDGTVAAGTTVGRILLGGSVADVEQLESSDEPVRVDSVAFRPGGDELATGRAERRSDLAFDDTLTLWDVDAGTPRVRSGGDEQDVPGCAFFFHRLAYTGDGSTLANASHDRTIGIVDTATGAVTFRLPARTGSILDLAFAADDTRLVVSADDNRIEIWDTADWTVVTTIDSNTGGYSALAVLPDGATLVVADVTGGLAAIDLVTGERLLAFEGLLPPRPTELAVDPGGSLVASPLPGHAIGIWSTDTGELLATLAGHTDRVTGLSFAPDGSLLVSAASDGTLRSWSIDQT